VRLIKLDPRHPIAEEIMTLAPRDRLRLDIHRRGMNTLPHAVDRYEAQDVARIGDRGGIVISRDLPDVVDHPSASQRTSARSCVVK